MPEWTKHIQCWNFSGFWWSWYCKSKDHTLHSKELRDSWVQTWYGLQLTRHYSSIVERSINPLLKEPNVNPCVSILQLYKRVLEKLWRANHWRHKKKLSQVGSMCFSTMWGMVISYIHKAFTITKHISMHYVPVRPSSDGILHEIIHTKSLEGAWASEQACDEWKLLL